MNIFVSQFGNFFTDIFDAIGNFFSTIGAIFTGILDYLFEPIWMLLYYTFIAIAQIANFCEVVFKKVAGLDTIYVAGEAYGGAQQIGSQGAGSTGGLVMAFLGNDTVYKTLIAIIIFSVVLLFLTTIIAIIKAEFSLDLKTSAKGPIIGRALKSLVMFFIVPIVTVLGIYLTNIITLSVNQLLSGTSSQGIVNNCFKCAAYNANRGRNSEIYKNYYATGLQDLSGNVLGWTPDDVDAAFVKTFTPEAVDFPVVTMGDAKQNVGLGASALSLFTGAFNMVANFNEGGNANFHMILHMYPMAGQEMNFYRFDQVRYFYDMASFDYIIGIGTALVMSWILLSTCLALIKRVFEITMLMLLAPPMIALAPLDNGQAQKKWQGEMLKRVIATIGPVFAFNMYFLLVPLFSSISLFANTGFLSAVAGSPLSVGASQTGMPFLAAAAIAVVAYDLFMQLIIVIVGLSIVKQASAMISNLLGIEDLVKSGMDTSKKAVATAASVASMAFGGAGLAVKGVAAGMKAAKAIGKSVNKARAAKAATKGKGRLANKRKGLETDVQDAESGVQNAQETADKKMEEYVDMQRQEGESDQAFAARQEAALADAEAAEKEVEKKKALRDAAKADLESFDSGDFSAAKGKKGKTAEARKKTREEAYEASEKEKARAQTRDDAKKKAQEEFDKSDKTIEDQRKYDDAIAAADYAYKRDKAGKEAKAYKPSAGTRFARSGFAQAFMGEFGKNATGTSIFAGSKHMDKNANTMWRMVLDNWVGIMGGKEDGAGLIVRRALEKTERERFFYSGKENKQLELKREQGLLMQERANSEANIQKTKQKEQDKQLLKQMLSEQGYKGDDLEQAFLNALNRHAQGKKVGGFEEYKKKHEEQAQSDAKQKAIQAKVEAHNVDIEAAKAIEKAQQKEREGKQYVEFTTDTLSKFKENMEKAMKSANAEQKRQMEAGIKSAEAGTLTKESLKKLEDLAAAILGKLK